MRISDAEWLLLALAGCSAGGTSADIGDRLIDCALGGAAAFSHDCSVERRRQEGRDLLIVHHPDGGFRRFELVEGGDSLAAADGAAAVAVARNDGTVDASVDGDRYRFPSIMLSDESAR